MEEDNQQTNIPMLCTKGCGFYGNQAYRGLCSKCHNSLKMTEECRPPSSRKASADLKQPICDKAGSWPLSTPSSSEVLTSPGEKVEDAGKTKPDASPAAPSEESGLPPASAKAKSEPTQAPANKKRCGVCNSRLGLTGFECDCGGFYCSQHRYTDEHSCTFDYRGKGQSEIRQANPVIASSKVNKI